MIFKLVLFAVGVCLVSVVLKENFKSGAIVLTVAGCVMLFTVFVKVFDGIKAGMSSLHIPDGIDTDAISIILKTLMVAYLTSFGSDICTDAGEKAIANALETAGKAIMLSMALPMLFGIFKSVSDIFGG